MAAELELRVLGPLELLLHGVPTPVRGVKPRQLLAMLALHHRRTVSVDQLVDVLWPEHPPRSARANVHTYVSALRTRLGGDRIEQQPPGYRLRLAPDELDMARFDGCPELDEPAPGADPSTLAVHLDAQLALWRGDPVEDLPASALWRPEVDRLVERWRTLRQRRAGLRIDAGDRTAAIADLRALVAEDPLREDAWLLLVTALDATGRRAEALTAYANVRRLMATELGIEPGEPLRRLYRRLLAGQDLTGPTERASSHAYDGHLGIGSHPDTSDGPAAGGGGVAAAGGVAGLDPSGVAVLHGLGALNMGPVPGWVATALLDGADAGPVLRNLELLRLVQRDGVDPVGQQRFHLPFVAALLAPDLPGRADEAMLRRVLGGYLFLAEQAAQALPGGLTGPADRVAERWAVPAGAELTRDPIGWFTTERQALLAAVELAAKLDWAALAWETARALLPWCDLGGHTTEWEQSHHTALTVCRRTNDLLGTAVTLRGLGQLHLYHDRYGAAADAFGRARLAYARLGHLHGEARALAGLGTVHRLRGELVDADDCYQRALTSYVTTGDRHGQAYVHGALGLLHLTRDDPAAALRTLHTALALAHEVDDQHRIAHLVHHVGQVQVRLDQPGLARQSFHSALDLFTVLGDAHGEAYCLSSLADLTDGESALRHLNRALDIFEQIGDRQGQEQTAQRLGELYRNSGRDRLGEAYLAEARRLRATVADELGHART